MKAVSQDMGSGNMICKNRTCAVFARCKLAPMKELKQHGVDLQGPAAKLLNAGTKGKHPGNISRDIARQLGKMVPSWHYVCI